MKLRFALILTVFLGLLAFIHLVAFQALDAIFQFSDPAVVLAVKLVFVVLGFSFISLIFIDSRFNNIATRALSKISSVWVGFLLYLFLAGFVYGVFLALLGSTISPDVAVLVGKILVAGSVIISIYGVFNANHALVTKYSVSLPNLPPVWKGRKAVLVSDVHLGQIRSEKFAEKVTSIIADLNADIVFIAGDLFDGVEIDAVNVLKPFLKLKTPLGNFFVMGNHEELRDGKKYFDAITSSGIQVLSNEKKNIDGVDIIGVDYTTNTSKVGFKKTLESLHVDKNIPSILLKHVPFDLEVSEQAGISLQLSGHTHRAQMFPFSLVTRFIYRGYDYGLKSKGLMQVLVSSGVGTWGPPLRVLTKSEIVLITFK